MRISTKRIIKKKGPYIIISIVAIMVIVMIISALIHANPQRKMDTYLKNEKYTEAIQFYNNKMIGSAKQKRYQQKFLSCIEEIVESWTLQEMDYKEAVKKLEVFAKTEDSVICDEAVAQISYITIEGEGAYYLLEAENFYKEGNYLEAFESVSHISEKYSLYQTVLEFYETNKAQLLASLTLPTSMTGFQEVISLLEQCVQYMEDEDLLAKKVELEKEYQIFKEVYSIIEDAQYLYAGGYYKEAFATLEEGLEKYPENEKMQNGAKEIEEVFVVDITVKAKTECSKEEYKKALEIVNTAIEQHDCEELQILLETIKEEKSIIYRITNKFKKGWQSFTQGWTTKIFGVQQVHADAASYIVHSGEKILLGDYSEEDITVLSLSGNIAASIANLDLLFDIRDLTYDLQHLGDEEYMVAYLAADVIALLPVLGVVKYFKYMDKAADISKHIDDVDEMADAIIDVSKKSKKIGETIEKASEVAKKTEDVSDTSRLGNSALDVMKHYEYVITKNANLAGRRHPQTDVLFELKKVDYSDGRKIQAVFAQFDSKVDIQLPENLYKESFSKQKKYLNNQLKEMIKDKKWIDVFSKEELEDIANNIDLENYVWHHNEKEGLMQLVDANIHAKTGHDGGMKFWGAGH